MTKLAVPLWFVLLLGCSPQQPDAPISADPIPTQPRPTAEPAEEQQKHCEPLSGAQPQPTAKPAGVQQKPDEPMYGLPIQIGIEAPPVPENISQPWPPLQEEPPLPAKSS